MRTRGAIGVLVLGWIAASTVVMGQVRTIPAGAQVQVLLQTVINSGVAKPDQRFEATLLEKHEIQGQVVLAAGVVVRGFISSVKPLGRVDHQGQVTLSFEGIQMPAGTLRLRASVVAVLDPKRPDQSSRLSTGPVVGGRVGDGIAALTGVFVGDGGSIVSTNGTNVNLPIGTVLRIRLDQSIEVPVVR